MSNDRALLPALLGVQSFMYFAFCHFSPKSPNDPDDTDDYTKSFRVSVSKEASAKVINRCKITSHLVFTSALGALRYRAMQPFWSEEMGSWEPTYGFWCATLTLGFTLDISYFKWPWLNRGVFLTGSLLKIIAQLQESKEDKLDVDDPIKAEIVLSSIALLLIFLRRCWVYRRKNPTQVTRTAPLLEARATAEEISNNTEQFNYGLNSLLLIVPTLLTSSACGVLTYYFIYYDKKNMRQNILISCIAFLAMFFDGLYIPLKMYYDEKEKAKHRPNSRWEKIVVSEGTCLLLSFIATLGVSLIGSMKNESNPDDWLRNLDMLRISSLACEGNGFLVIMIIGRNTGSIGLTKISYMMKEKLYTCLAKLKFEFEKFSLPPTRAPEGTSGSATSNRLHSPNTVLLGPWSLNSAQDTQRPHP